MVNINHAYVHPDPSNPDPDPADDMQPPHWNDPHDMTTDEMDMGLVLRPDGVGGVEFASVPGMPPTQLEETGGPTVLDMGAVADGEYLKRSGATIVGDTPAGGGGSTIYNPFEPLVSPNAMDDEFNDDANMSGAVNGLDAQWTWRNQGAAAITFPHPGVMRLAVPAAASPNYRGIEQPTGGDGTWIVYCSLDADALNYALGGMWMVDNVNGDFYALQIGFQTIASGVRSFLQISRYTNVTTYLSDPFGFTSNQPIGGVWLKMQLLAGNIIVSYSTENSGWLRMGSFADGVGVTRVGLFANESNNTGRTACVFRGFRKVA